MSRFQGLHYHAVVCHCSGCNQLRFMYLLLRTSLLLLDYRCRLTSVLCVIINTNANTNTNFVLTAPCNYENCEVIKQPAALIVRKDVESFGQENKGKGDRVALFSPH